MSYPPPPCRCVFERNLISVPPSITEALDLRDGTVLECTVADGHLCLTPTAIGADRTALARNRRIPKTESLISVECFDRFSVQAEGCHIRFAGQMCRGIAKGASLEGVETRLALPSTTRRKHCQRLCAAIS